MSIALQRARALTGRVRELDGGIGMHRGPTGLLSSGGVNFFGHATVASWEARTPGFVLGAMLPDLAAMAGTRLIEVDDADLGAGVTLHHQTDRAFHATASFVALCREATRTLGAQGLRGGKARAVAHVGVELLLDGWLVEQRDAREAYAEALRCGCDRELGRRIRWAHEDGHARWSALRRTLEEHGPPEDYREPTVVASRVERVLRERPRLALVAPERDLTARFVPELQRAVRARADSLISELRAGLEREAGRLRARPNG